MGLGKVTPSGVKRRPLVIMPDTEAPLSLGGLPDGSVFCSQVDPSQICFYPDIILVNTDSEMVRGALDLTSGDDETEVQYWLSLSYPSDFSRVLGVLDQWVAVPLDISEAWAKFQVLKMPFESHKTESFKNGYELGLSVHPKERNLAVPKLGRNLRHEKSDIGFMLSMKIVGHLVKYRGSKVLRRITKAIGKVCANA